MPECRRKRGAVGCGRDVVGRRDERETLEALLDGGPRKRDGGGGRCGFRGEEIAEVGESRDAEVGEAMLEIDF